MSCYLGSIEGVIVVYSSPLERAPSHGYKVVERHCEKWSFWIMTAFTCDSILIHMRNKSGTIWVEAWPPRVLSLANVPVVAYEEEKRGEYARYACGQAFAQA